jgi:hypothetical protein
VGLFGNVKKVSVYFAVQKDDKGVLLDGSKHNYSIGSSTPGLQTAAEGSITIHFQAKSPGKDKESNWLPAPEGPFWLVLRTYGPGEAIQHGTWKVPPVKQSD